MLEEDGDQLDGLCEKWSISWSQGRTESATIKRRKATRIGHVLRGNCHLKHVIEGKMDGRIEVMVRRGRRCKQLLDGLKAKRGYWKVKEEALDRTLRRTGFGKGCEPVTMQTTEWMNEWMNDRVSCNVSIWYSPALVSLTRLSVWFFV
jgi:ribosomal protein L35